MTKENRELNKKSLCRLNMGEKGVVKLLLSQGVKRQRFMDLGIIQGTEIIPLFKSPFGDPTAYLIKNTVIALRYEDSENIIMY